MDSTVIRDIQAPTEDEARTMAVPILDAFRAAGWELREALWIPGDRRPGLGESLLLSPGSENLLEGEGTLHLMFAHPDPLAVAPSVAPAARVPDAFESIGGVRYRRLVPRWGLGIVIAIVGLILLMALGSGSGRLFGAAPTPDGGACPIGWVPGMKAGYGDTLVPDGTCQRLP